MITTKDKKLSKSEESSLNSGLVIENSIKVSYVRHGGILNSLILVLIAFLGVFGTIFAFITLFNIQVDVTSIVLWNLVFFAMFSVVSMLPDRYLIAIFPILLIFMYIFRDYVEEFILGFKIVSNSVADTVYKAGVWMKYYDIPNDIVPQEYTTIFIEFCTFLFIGLVCLFTIKVNSCIIGFILTFPFLECGVYFGAVPNYVAFFMVVCYWVALLSMNFSGCKKTTKNRLAGFVRIENSFFAKADCNFRISEKVGVYAVAMCVVCAIVSSLLVSIVGYERSDRINSIRRSVIDYVGDFSVDDTSYLVSRLGEMFKAGSSGTFNGTLGQKGSVTFKGDEKLILKTSEVPTNDIYLKSYVGTTYTGNSWDKLDDSAYKVSAFDGFKSTGIYPQALPNLQLQNDFNSIDVTILPTNKSSKTALVPYFASFNDGYSYVNDTTVTSKSTDEYSFTILDVSVTKVLSNIDAYETTSSFDNESYREFVDQYYLTVEDNSSMQEVKEIFTQYLSYYNLDFETIKSNADIYTKIQYVKNFLCANYEYSLSPGQTPIGTDYVLYFLKESKKGYCSHFASAGTILCRMLDIPTRYVEGYYVEQASFNSTCEVSVKDNVAHAWTEVYIDNLGWINVDFTPGFNGNPTIESFQVQNEPNSTEESPSTEPFEDTQTQMALVTDVTTSVDTDSQTTDTTTTEPTTDEPSKPLISPETLRAIKHILVVLLSIGLLIAVVLLRRKYIVDRRSERMSSKDVHTSVLESYRYTMHTLKYLGFTQGDSTPYMQFANTVSQSVACAKGFPNIMQIALKSKLSNLELSATEQALVQEFATQLASTTYEGLSTGYRLVFKYILCLV